MSLQLIDATIQRFNEISWHDSKLLGFSVYKSEGEDRIKISVELLGKDGVLTPYEIDFKESVFIETALYLEAKGMCADDISDAECYVSSDWKSSVSEPQPFDVIQGGRGFEQHLHFRINMCPPGGTINILAKNFSLEMTALGRASNEQN